MKNKIFLVLAYKYPFSELEFLCSFNIEASDKEDVVKKSFQKISKEYPKKDKSLFYLDIEQTA